MSPTPRQIFASLPLPVAGVYSAQPLPRNPGYRLGRSTEGRPVLLIDVANAANITSLIDVRSQHLSVRHGRRCEITEPNHQTFTGMFSLIICLSDDPAMQGYFVDFVETIARILGDGPNAADINSTVQSVIELFGALRQPPRTTVQGAWAELLLIACARDPFQMATAWHRNPTDTYDFNGGAQRIEVKSSGSGDRRHHFTWDQLSPPSNVKLLIASLFVYPSAGGTTIEDLLSRIRSSLTTYPDVLEHTERTIATTLGSTLLEALEVGHDEQRAIDSLRFYDSAAIPRPSSPFPVGVSHVAFVSDVDAVPTLNADWMATQGGLFVAALRSESLGS